jgi:phosphomannomutase
MLLDMAKEVVKGKYHFGIAIDGDADRITVIDGDGKFYDCNYLSAAFYYYLTQIKKQKGGAVKNFLTSNLINKLCAKYGFGITETPVGFKFLGLAMQQTDALIGAESGGMGFKSISHSKDGIATAAFLIDLVATMRKSIGAIVDELVNLVSFPSHFVEYAYPFHPIQREGFLEKLLSGDKPKFANSTAKVDTYADGFKITFEGDHWAGARISGTESAVRIYTEMPNQKACGEVIAILEQFYNLPERQK